MESDSSQTCTAKGEEAKLQKKPKQNPLVSKHHFLQEGCTALRTDAKRSRRVSTHQDFENSAGQGPEQAVLTEWLVVL